jgi:hypothetical protein
VRARVPIARHALLSVLTGGLWLVGWAALLIGTWMRPWRCAACGWHKPEFRPECRRKSAGPIPVEEGKKVQPPTVE